MKKLNKKLTAAFDRGDDAETTKIAADINRLAKQEEDYQKLDEILKSAGVKTYRSFLDREKFKSLHEIYRPPVNPRDHFAVIGEKIYCTGETQGYADVLKQIDDKVSEEFKYGTV